MPFVKSRKQAGGLIFALLGLIFGKIRKKKAPVFFRKQVLLANDPNFNTNAPPFRLRGCIAVKGGAFFPKGVQTM